MENRKILLYQLKALFVMLVLFSVTIVLLRMDISNRVQNIRNIRADISLALGASDATALLKSDAALASPFVSIVENLLPAQNELVVFANDVKGIASQYKVSADVRFRGESAKAGDSLLMTSVAIDAQGEFSQIMSFINALNHSKYFLKITSADIIRASGENVRVNLSGAVFSINR